MKKIIVPIILAVFATAASAQNMYDAIAFSENNYYGTARSVGVGNAMTAIGGDLGSIGLNPAGSAIANYSQISITPGLSIAGVGAGYDINGNRTANYDIRTRQTSLTVPNAGVSLILNTGNGYGINKFSFGFIVNQTSNFKQEGQAIGRNAVTSKLAELASGAGGVNESILANYNSFNDTGANSVSWDLLTGYQSGMFAPPAGFINRYVGLTEELADDAKYHYVPGTLIQNSQRYKSGTKKDILINFGFDFADQIYFGFNLGIPTARYSYTDFYSEAAEDPEQFPVTFAEANGGKGVTTYFSSASMQYEYFANVAGVYAKAGVIYLPGNGLRLGAAVQSPTAYTVSERWQYRGATILKDGNFNGSQNSPVGEGSYNLRSPWEFNLGFAYTFGTAGFISLDYEMTDYSVMRFSSARSRNFRDGTYADLNDANKLFAGASHAFRIGGEIKINPAFSVRAGYNILTSPVKVWSNNKGETVTVDDYLYWYQDYYNKVKTLVNYNYVSDQTHAFTAGFGYSSGGPFFADFAVRLTSYPSSEYRPYYDYVAFDKTGKAVAVDAKGNPAEAPAPKVTAALRRTDILLTLGWRF